MNVKNLIVKDKNYEREREYLKLKKKKNTVFVIFFNTNFLRIKKQNVTSK